MSIRIITPGPLTTVQDLGIRGQMKNGFPASGAMDAFSASLANILCGNERDAALLEMTLLGIDAEFLDRTVFAICGADMQPKLNGKPVPMNTAVCAAPGDRLTLSKADSGCRSYIAFCGGIDVPPVMGSGSTSLKCGIGGYKGRKLAAGDIIPVMPTKLIATDNRTLPYNKKTDSLITLRAVPGPQDDYFTADAINTFFGSEYTVTPKSDRMGIRLEGKELTSIDGTDIVSDGIAEGSVQVPSGGQPIVLMADRQTTGGYAKIATVISADLPLIAQAVPGDRITFKKATRDEALTALKKQEEYLQDKEKKWTIHK